MEESPNCYTNTSDVPIQPNKNIYITKIEDTQVSPTIAILGNTKYNTKNTYYVKQYNNYNRRIFTY